MVDRMPLRRQLLAAWEECIKEDYPRHIINSEHGLQAVLHHRLRGSLPEKWSIYVEPSFRFPLDEKTEVVPDLLICNSRRIIAVIELKYQPRVRMDYAKDLRTLAAIAERSGTLTMRNERYRGPGEGAAEFVLADDPLFVWAGIHCGETVHEQNDLCQTKEGRTLSDAVGDRFFQLHAVTCSDADPDPFSSLDLS